MQSRCINPSQAIDFKTLNGIGGFGDFGFKTIFSKLFEFGLCGALSCFVVFKKLWCGFLFRMLADKVTQRAFTCFDFSINKHQYRFVKLITKFGIVLVAIGLLNKIRAYELQDGGADTVEANERLGFGADQRDYAICLPMLDHLGISQLKLMTNNPRKVKALGAMGINVATRVPLQIDHNPFNQKYLATKAGKLGHMLGSLHQGEVEESL